MYTKRGMDESKEHSVLPYCLLCENISKLVDVSTSFCYTILVEVSTSISLGG